MTNKIKTIKSETDIQSELYPNYNCKNCPVKKGKCK